MEKVFFLNVGQRKFSDSNFDRNYNLLNFLSIGATGGSLYNLEFLSSRCLNILNRGICLDLNKRETYQIIELRVQTSLNVSFGQGLNIN